MLVFWEKRLALLAVPKTGSTALSNALAPHASLVLRDPPELKHSPIYRYERFLAPFFEKAGGGIMETMAIVREPVSWLASWYRYRHRDQLVGHPNSTRDVSFDAFVLEHLKGKGAPFASVGSQAKFLCRKNGEIGVDHLFRYEAQEAITAFLEDRLSLKLTTKQVNVSPQMELALSAEVEARLRRKFAREFDVWEAGRT